MPTVHIEVLVEEPSAEVAISSILRTLLEGLSATFVVHPFGCKTELLQRLPQRLRGYKSGMPEVYYLFVLVDRDDHQCLRLKQSLNLVATEAGLVVRGIDKPYRVVNRLIVEELEAWYFGDWEAVMTAYLKTDPKACMKSQFRDPDAIRGGTWEALERELRKAGYFASGFRKIELARAVSTHMIPSRNRSNSFQAFAKAVLDCCQGTGHR